MPTTGDLGVIDILVREVASILESDLVDTGDSSAAATASSLVLAAVGTLAGVMAAHNLALAAAREHWEWAAAVV